jgi:hypothetical protein
VDALQLKSGTRPPRLQSELLSAQLKHGVLVFSEWNEIRYWVAQRVQLIYDLAGDRKDRDSLNAENNLISDFPI